jgi:glutathione synthase/RimK-type ligase-like ATP-grasp enzyme
MDNGTATSRRSSTTSTARLFKQAFDGHDLKPLRAQLLARMEGDPLDAAALMDLSVTEQLLGNQAEGLRHQAQALHLRRLYRPSWPTPPQALRVLALMAPGDLGNNTPIEFLLDGSDIALHILYVVPGQPLPNSLPEHDIAIATPCESDQNRAVLREIQRLIPSWPCTVLNRPDGIMRSARERMHSLLGAVPELLMPATVQVCRTALEQMGHGSRAAADFLSEATFPLIVRPVDSHAGRSLAKLDEPSSIAAYLASQQEPEFFVSRFVDYRGSDGLFRKYRVMWVDSRAYPVHMAISEGWKVWYYNAGMANSAGKREEEARFMAEFDNSFARRHARALEAIAERFGLEYFGIDCAELPDGRLLVFEGGVDLAAHDMDRPDVYPYKSAHMQKLFAAFREMLNRKSVRDEVTV